MLLSCTIQQKLPQKDWSKNQIRDFMLMHQCFDIPIQENDRLIGHVLFQDLLDNPSSLEILEGFAGISVDSHIYDALTLMRNNDVTCLAVVDLNFSTLGFITTRSIQKYLGATLTSEQPGAVLQIEMASFDFSASEICRIIEAENAHVLGFWLSKITDSNRVRLNVKLNSLHAEAIILSLRRFGYDVVGNFGDEDYRDTINQRFKSLLNHFDL